MVVRFGGRVQGFREAKEIRGFEDLHLVEPWKREWESGECCVGEPQVRTEARLKILLLIRRKTKTRSPNG